MSRSEAVVGAVASALALAYLGCVVAPGECVAPRRLEGDHCVFADAGREVDAGTVDARSIDAHLVDGQRTDGDPKVDAGAGDSTIPDACATVPEVCDGVDQDCDGMIDNGAGLCAAPLTCARGACRDIVVQLAAAVGHTCARRSSGTVSCWGANSNGQLGDGTTDPHTVPANVVDLAEVASIAAGFGDHTCAILESGALTCWGSNSAGQLGDGTTMNRSAPVPVAILTSNVVHVALGLSHTCAVYVEAIRCWGSNDAGQLGFAPTMMPTTTPRSLGATLLGPTAVAAGERHSCARLAGGTIACWGQGTNGQLGDGASTSSASAVTVMGLGDAADAVAGAFFTNALRLDRTVVAWGSNSFGQLGDGSTTNRLSPVAVPRLVDVAQIAPGRGFACARLRDGRVMCWGNDAFGQLGNGDDLESRTAIPVPGIEDAVDLATGDAHACVTRRDGTVSCWGLNDRGQLGDGTTMNRVAPVNVMGLD